MIGMADWRLKSTPRSAWPACDLPLWPAFWSVLWANAGLATNNIAAIRPREDTDAKALPGSADGLRRADRQISLRRSMVYEFFMEEALLVRYFHG
jgi:hypothetical protein